MSRPAILTAAALARVTHLVRQGNSAAAIAAELGCTVGTLRVRCSQNGISLRRDGVKPFPAWDSFGPPSIHSRNSGELAGLSQTTPGLSKTQSPSPHQLHVALNIVLRHDIAEGLRELACRNGVSGEAFAAELLTIIETDNLYQAVLDHD